MFGFKLRLYIYFLEECPFAFPILCYVFLRGFDLVGSSHYTSHEMLQIFVFVKSVTVSHTVLAQAKLLPTHFGGMSQYRLLTSSNDRGDFILGLASCQQR